MTREEARAVYRRIDPVESGHFTEKHWREVEGEVLAVRRAPDYRKAVDVLRKFGWGDPEGCAREILKLKRCPTCSGHGVVKKKEVSR